MREHIVFMYGEVNCRPRWCWGNAHAGAGGLPPVRVSELEDVILEDYFDGFDKGCSIVVVEATPLFAAE